MHGSYEFMTTAQHWNILETSPRGGNPDNSPETHWGKAVRLITLRSVTNNSHHSELPARQLSTVIPDTYASLQKAQSYAIVGISKDYYAVVNARQPGPEEGRSRRQDRQLTVKQQEQTRQGHPASGCRGGPGQGASNS